MPVDFSETLVVAVSARALFNVESENRVFLDQGLEAFSEAQRKAEGIPFTPGPAFHFVRGMLRINGMAKTAGRGPLVEVVVLSSQHPDTGMRILGSVAHHDLPISRSVFTGGAPTSPYLAALGVDLLLTRSLGDAQSAVNLGVAAGAMLDLAPGFVPDDTSVRIALDGDAVLFSDESEALYKTHGIEAFSAHEKKNAMVPMLDGPFGPIMRGLHRIQKAVPGALRIAMVTARNAPAHERSLRTLRSWGVEIDEAFFLGGMPKAPFLAAFGAALFFDDQDDHLTPASKLVPCAKVPYRIGGHINIPAAA